MADRFTERIPLMRLLIVTALLSLGIGSAVAADWMQWRGPNRDGVATGMTLPGEWPERLETKWRITAGTGHSSPVVSNGRIYQFSRLGENEMLIAVDPATGKTLWKQSYDAPYTMSQAALAHGKGPKSTPVVDGGHIYTLGISGILTCFELETGKIVWQKEFAGAFSKTSPLYGTAMSPIVHAGLLIAHVGGHGGGAMTAFDLNTGAEKWSWKGDGPGYSSPVVVELDGVRQLVTQSEQKTVSFSPADGSLLWERPFKTPYAQNSVTPMVHDGLLIISGLQNATSALRVKRSGGRWTTETVWETNDAYMYMNSPVIAGGTMVGFTHRNSGQYFCQNPKTGEITWQGKPRSGDNAAIIRSGETLLMLSTGAELTVARVSGGKLTAVKNYSVADSPTWAHPVPAPGGLLIKDLNTLALLAW
jgi:outer membrane protein assembly factor BamB